jgi:hypothetical protein
MPRVGRGVDPGAAEVLEEADEARDLAGAVRVADRGEREIVAVGQHDLVHREPLGLDAPARVANVRKRAVRRRDAHLDRLHAHLPQVAQVLRSQALRPEVTHSQPHRITPCGP